RPPAVKALRRSFRCKAHGSRAVTFFLPQPPRPADDFAVFGIGAHVGSCESVSLQNDLRREILDRRFCDEHIDSWIQHRSFDRCGNGTRCIPFAPFGWRGAIANLHATVSGWPSIAAQPNDLSAGSDQPRPT